MQAPKLLCNLASRQAGRRAYHFRELPGGTLNDLPSPQGNWKTHYDSQQRKYNARLVVGISVLVGTIITGRASGLLEFYNDIPERPADIASYR